MVDEVHCFSRLLNFVRTLYVISVVPDMFIIADDEEAVIYVSTFFDPRYPK